MQTLDSLGADACHLHALPEDRGLGISLCALMHHRPRGHNRGGRRCAWLGAGQSAQFQ